MSPLAIIADRDNYQDKDSRQIPTLSFHRPKGNPVRPWKSAHLFWPPVPWTLEVKGRQPKKKKNSKPRT